MGIDFQLPGGNLKNYFLWLVAYVKIEANDFAVLYRIDLRGQWHSVRVIRPQVRSIIAVQNEAVPLASVGGQKVSMTLLPSANFFL